jgi:hypothetical protein
LVTCPPSHRTLRLMGSRSKAALEFFVGAFCVSSPSGVSPAARRQAGVGFLRRSGGRRWRTGSCFSFWSRGLLVCFPALFYFAIFVRACLLDSSDRNECSKICRVLCTRPCIKKMMHQVRWWGSSHIPVAPFSGAQSHAGTARSQVLNGGASWKVVELIKTQCCRRVTRSTGTVRSSSVGQEWTPHVAADLDGHCSTVRPELRRSAPSCKVADLCFIHIQ